MNDPLLGAKLKAIFEALRADVKPELQSPHAKLRCELMEMLLARLSVEADLDPVEDGPVDAEAAARNAQEDAILKLLAGPVEQSGSARELVIAPETFTQWFDANGIPGKVIKVTNVPGGRSKGTLLLDLADGGEMVVRLDFSAAVTGTSVTDEYPVIAAVHKAGLRVPEPFGIEQSSDVIGGRFIVFEKVPGKAMGTLFASDASPAFCKDFARTLARLHSLEIEDLALDDTIEFGLETNPVEALLDKREKEYRDNVRETPLIEAAFEWMRSELPQIGVQRRIVHGDAALHNAMGEGDTLTALLDWEFVHAGDPAEDLAYGRFLIENILPWEDFMAAYYDAGGPKISDRRMAFFRVWRTLTLSVWTGMARGAFDSGKDRDLRVAAIGHNTMPRQLRALANDLSREMNR
jgi:aminoglycoside phosphotransferase (APT) family kinase protein